MTWLLPLHQMEEAEQLVQQQHQQQRRRPGIIMKRRLPCSGSSRDDFRETRAQRDATNNNTRRGEARPAKRVN